MSEPIKTHPALLEDIALIGKDFFIDPECRTIGHKEIKHWNTTLLALSYVLDQNALIVGEPGFAKTTAAKVVASVLSGYPFDLYEAAQIQGHPDQTFETMLARLDFSKLTTEERVIWLSGAYLPVCIVDEMNRLPAGKQDELLNIIETGRFTYLNATLYKGKMPFIATANHPDDGNHILIPPMRDRFAIHLEAGYIGATYEEDIERAEENIGELRDDELTSKIFGIINDKTKDVPEKLTLIEKEREGYVAKLHNDDIGAQVLSEEEKKAVQKAIRDRPLRGEAQVFLQMIDAELNSTPLYGRKRSNDPVDESNHAQDLASTCVKNGTSPRAITWSMKLYAKGLAYLLEDPEVTKDHLMAMVPHALGHRLQCTQDFCAKHEGTKRPGPYGMTAEMYLASRVVGGIEQNYGKVKADLDLLITEYKMAHRQPVEHPLTEAQRARVLELLANPDQVDHPLLKEYIFRMNNERR
ncbi:AAA family ATPase [Candidatus Woesearchaeota archaeon]|nr:AAA family ATPase [Candidatus Woesearchaeota archaeon]